MIITRTWAMPNHNTFDIKPIGEFVQKYLQEGQVSVDPFARNKELATYTNDLNPNTQAQYHMEAEDFLIEMNKQNIKANLVIFDPPYSTRQIKECYDGIGKKGTSKDMQAPWSIWKKHINDLCFEDSIVLSFGWNTVGMGLKYGFKQLEIMLVCHGGSHNDTICMAEQKVLQIKSQGELLY